MEHKTCRENLSAYLDGELPEQEKALLEAHLASCPDCRAVLGQLGTVSGIFKKHAMEPVPLSLKGEVLGGRVKTAYPWFKPVLAFSTIAAGVLIVLNVTKNPEQTSLMMVSKNNAFESKLESMDAAAARPSEDAGRFAGSAGEAIPAAPAVVASPAEEATLPMPELNKERAEKKAAAPRAMTAVSGAYSQAKFAASRTLGSLSSGMAGAGGNSSVAAVAGAKAEADGYHFTGDGNHISVSCKVLNARSAERLEVKLSPEMKAALDKFSPGFKLRGLEEYSAKVLEHYCYDFDSNPSAVRGDFNGDGRPDAHLIGYQDGWLERLLLLSTPAGTYNAVSLGKYKYDGLEAAVKKCPWCYDKEKKLRNAYYQQPKGSTYHCGGDHLVMKRLENDGIALLDLWEKGLYISHVSIWDEKNKGFVDQHCVLNPCSEHECP